CRGTTSHRNEKEHEHDNEKSVSKRNECSPRHPRHSGREGRICDHHRHERRSEHPWQRFHAARANAVPNWFGDVIAGQDQEMEKEREPERANFVGPYLNDPGVQFFHARLRHSAKTSASRSAERPAFGCDWRSWGSDLNQASVSRAVTSSGRNVRPLLNARLMFVRATASSFPVQTGMSDQGCTFCSVKKSSLTQVNFASDFRAPLILSSIPPMPSGLAGPVAL